MCPSCVWEAVIGKLRPFLNVGSGIWLQSFSMWKTVTGWTVRLCTFQLGYLKLSSAAFVFTHVNRNMHAHTNTHTQTYIQGGCLEDQCGYWLGCCLSSWCRVRGEPCLSPNPNILLNPNIFLAHSFVCKSEVCVCVCVCVCACACAFCDQNSSVVLWVEGGFDN